MRKLTLAIIGAASSIAMMSSVANAASCGKVSITEMNWASSQIITEVAKFLMEQGYGCKVEKVPSATTTAVASLAENGEPDIVTELWLNSTGDAYSKMEKAGKVERLADVLAPGGVEGCDERGVAGVAPDQLERRHRVVRATAALVLDREADPV